MSNGQNLGPISIGGSFLDTGIGNSYGSYNTSSFQGSAFNTYAGIANNYAGAVAANVISSTGLFQSYTGYNSSFNGLIAAAPVPNPPQLDNQIVFPWSKQQQIYYKLVGFNTNTQSFETWIIAEEIVPRPETFDPTGNPPSVDYNVYFAPPSGNKLVNIKIVGRWIQ
jgi:hypothetical protein